MDLPFEEYFLQCDDGVMIHTWLIPQKDRKSAPTVVFFHGNAGNIGNRLYNAKCMYHYLRCNVLLVEYRGFGNSQGSPSEAGFKLDAIAALDFISSRPDLDTTRIFVFGRSLGGAVSVWLAHHRPAQIRGLVLENTFTSVSDMFFVLVARMIALGRLEAPLRVFLGLFMTSHWRSIALMPSLRVPTLFISGLDDELVPAKHMQALHDEMDSDTYRQFYGVPGGGHNTTYVDGSHTYWRTFSAFLDKVGK
jgi:pimeloyl-ACP methyl ester carboxylesterase